MVAAFSLYKSTISGVRYSGHLGFQFVCSIAVAAFGNNDFFFHHFCKHCSGTRTTDLQQIRNRFTIRLNLVVKYSMTDCFCLL